MDQSRVNEILRQIPGVDAVLQLGPIQDALLRHPRKLVLEAIRIVLDATRQAILHGEGIDAGGIDHPGLADRIVAQVEHLARFTLRRTINATGIVIHTNLGRSLLPA
ncbi:MAG: L-seryl-tRNA(Sec) selenium transferase, partial [Syntrophobacteraceae bacterium]